MTVNTTHSPIEILTTPETFSLITQLTLELVRISATPKGYVTHGTVELLTINPAGISETHFIMEMLANIPAPIPPSRMTHSPVEIIFSTTPNVCETHMVIEILNKIYVPTPEVRTTRVGPRLQSH